MVNDPVAASTAELARCQAVVGRLHKMCCEPDRSPRMQMIEDGLERAQLCLTDGITDEAATEVFEILTDIGATIGGLQVECCTEGRMPLYAEALERLTKTQLRLNAELGRSH